jgi:hypothetical protein
MGQKMENEKKNPPSHGCPPAISVIKERVMRKTTCPWFLSRVRNTSIFLVRAWPPEQDFAGMYRPFSNSGDNLTEFCQAVRLASYNLNLITEGG